MADFLSRDKRSKVMSSIKSRANKDTELCLMAIFRANRIRGWQRNARILGKPDFIFRQQRIAVFVDGCFWHGCPTHGHYPTTNEIYWAEKLTRNKARDRSVTTQLKKQGWRVVRVWEHSLKKPQRLILRLRRLFLSA